MGLSVKVIFGTEEAPEGEIRRFSLPDDLSEDNYTFIIKKIAEWFPTEEGKETLLHWKG